MLRYVARRLLLGLFTLWVAVSLVFLIVHLIPGDPVTFLLGDYYSEAAADELRSQLGLDRPLLIQYGDFLQGLLTGDLGRSLITRLPVFEEIVINLQFTIQLAFAGIIVSVLIGIPAGVISALYRGRFADMVTMTTSLLGVSMPPFWLGILLMIFFGVTLGWLPMIGVGESGNLTSQLRHLILPALTLGLRGAALTARVTRSSMLEVLGQDYVRTARAKGLSNFHVNQRHALRNAMLPVVTVIGLDLGQMLGGAAIVEIVFSRPGLGSLLINAVLNRDYPMVQGAFLVFISIIILSNLIV